MSNEEEETGKPFQEPPCRRRQQGGYHSGMGDFIFITGPWIFLKPQTPTIFPVHIYKFKKACLKNKQTNPYKQSRYMSEKKQQIAVGTYGVHVSK